jgi:uncharacterized membrane protein (DUF373 family)
MERFIKAMHNATLVIEIIVSAALVVIAVGVMVSLFVEIWQVAGVAPTLTSLQFNKLIGLILEVFILIELFRIAVAYMQHKNVIPTVLEAALVGVARKFVVFEGAENYFLHAAGLATLLLAVAISWWLLARSNACELATE